MIRSPAIARVTRPTQPKWTAPGGRTIPPVPSIFVAARNKSAKRKLCGASFQGCDPDKTREALATWRDLPSIHADYDGLDATSVQSGMEPGTK